MSSVYRAEESERSERQEGTTETGSALGKRAAEEFDKAVKAEESSVAAEDGERSFGEQVGDGLMDGLRGAADMVAETADVVSDGLAGVRDTVHQLGSDTVDNLRAAPDNVANAYRETYGNFANGMNQALERGFGGDPMQIAEMPWNLGGKINIGVTNGIAANTGTWDSMNYRAKSETSGGISGKNYRLSPIDSLSGSHSSSLGVPATGTVNALSKGPAKVSMLNPIGFERDEDNGTDLARAHAWLGKGLGATKPKEPATAGPLQYNLESSATSTLWKGLGLNIERSEDEQGRMNPTSVELSGWLGTFSQTSVEANVGVGVGENAARVGPGVGVFHSNGTSLGLMASYERQVDSRNGGDPHLAAVINEGVKAEHGADGLLSLLHNEARQGIEPRSYDDPVRQQLIEAAANADVDLGNQLVSYDALSREVSQAIDSGVSPVVFAGKGGLDFGSREVREINASEHDQPALYVNSDLLDEYANVARMAEGQALRNRDDDGSLNLVVRDGNTLTTAPADPNHPAAAESRDLSLIERAGSELRDMVGGATQWTFNRGSNVIQGLNHGIQSTIVTDELRENLQERFLPFGQEKEQPE